MDEKVHGKAMKRKSVQDDQHPCSNNHHTKSGEKIDLAPSKLQSNTIKQQHQSKISISLGNSQNLKDTENNSTKPKNPKLVKTASIFEDSSDEEEEMPIEAKIRMRNRGKDTNTSAGPNSFGKGNYGFCDRNAILKREIEKQQQQLGED